MNEKDIIKILSTRSEILRMNLQPYNPRLPSVIVFPRDKVEQLVIHRERAQMTTMRVHINGSRRADPQTDDTRQMMDDLRRIEPLPIDSLDRLIREAAKQMSEDFDRQFMKAARGFL